MRRVTIYSIILLLGGLIFSCKPSKICPAYHSSFIIDPEVTRSTFSLFGPDSLPKDPEKDRRMVDKKKYGIADDFGYKKKNNRMAIIKMEHVYKKKDDPLDMPLAMAEMDSSMIDSLQIQRSEERYDDFYNYDQMIYLHYFGDYLPKPKPEADIEEDLENEDTMISDDEELSEEPKKEGFFKRLFKKKKKKKKKKKSDDELEGDSSEGEEEIIDDESTEEEFIDEEPDN